MYRGARIAIVVPAHNEARLIRGTLASIPAWADRIIVVDDGSDDETFKLASASDDLRVAVLRHRRNAGVGAAIASGYRAAFEDGADIAVVMAGDGQMHAEDLPALLEPLVERKAAYAKGNRLRWPNARAAMPTTRWVGNHVLSLLTRLATGLKVEDSQCGYTAISREAAAVLERQRWWHGYGYPNDLLGRLGRAGLAVQDVCVRPIYGEEQSGIRLRHITLTIPWVLVRVLLARLLVATRSPLSRTRTNVELSDARWAADD